MIENADLRLGKEMIQKYAAEMAFSYWLNTTHPESWAGTEIVAAGEGFFAGYMAALKKIEELNLVPIETPDAGT